MLTKLSHISSMIDSGKLAVSKWLKTMKRLCQSSNMIIRHKADHDQDITIMLRKTVVSQILAISVYLGYKKIYFFINILRPTISESQITVCVPVTQLHYVSNNDEKLDQPVIPAATVNQKNI